MQKIDRLTSSGSDLKFRPIEDGPVATRKSLHVERASDILDGSMCELEQKLTELESTLDPLVCKDIGKMMPTKEECRDHGGSDLAEHLRCTADRVDALTRRVKDLIDRL